MLQLMLKYIIHLFCDDLKLTRLFSIFLSHLCNFFVVVGRRHFRFRDNNSFNLTSISFQLFRNCNRMGFYETLACNRIDTVDCGGGWRCGTLSFTCFKWSVSRLIIIIKYHPYHTINTLDLCTIIKIIQSSL